MTMAVLRNTGHVFCRMPFGSLIFLLLELGFREEDHRGKILFSSHHLKDGFCQYALSLLVLTVITWLRWCLSGPPLDIYHPPFPYCRLWKDITMPCSHLRSGAQSICVNYLKFFVGDLFFSLIYIFIQSFICVCMDTWILYFILWVILSYLFIYILLLKFFCL